MKIGSYNFGSIVIEGKTYSQDVIVTKNRVLDNWRRDEGHNLCMEDLRMVLAEKPELLVIGTGVSGLMQVPLELRNRLKSQDIELIAEKTDKACKTYNRLHGSKNIIGCFHLTC